jgi:hypothetical protein
MLEKSFLILTAIVWVPYGVMCFLDPAALAESTGVVASTPTASTEIRAMYGGLQTAIGALALLAIFKSGLARSALVCLATLSAGLLTARLLGLAIDGGYTAYTGMAIGFEIFFFSCSLFLIGRREEAN